MDVATEILKTYMDGISRVVRLTVGIQIYVESVIELCGAQPL